MSIHSPYKSKVNGRFKKRGEVRKVFGVIILFMVGTIFLLLNTKLLHVLENDTAKMEKGVYKMHNDYNQQQQQQQHQNKNQNQNQLQSPSKLHVDSQFQSQLKLQSQALVKSETDKQRMQDQLDIKTEEFAQKEEEILELKESQSLALRKSKNDKQRLQDQLDEKTQDVAQKEKEIEELKEQLRNQRDMNEGRLESAKGDDELEKEEDNNEKPTATPMENSKDGYDPSKITFLNITDASIMKLKQPAPKQAGEYTIDVLIIGSISSISRAERQLKTWGSHTSRRHFWLATEFDDPDPNCHTSMTMEDLKTITNRCKTNDYWSNKSSLNALTKNWKNVFAREKWLKQKPNPTGWLCAQKRFANALSKLMKLYRDAKDEYGIDLPDYLVFGDDDTYINLEMVENQLLRTPQQVVRDKNLTLEDELAMVYPTQNTPVVWAGCRVRYPAHIVQDTSAFGGFGILFSRAAIERFIQPLYCNDGSTGFEWEACEHWTPAYHEVSIGDAQFFEPGMSVSDLMGSYVRNVETFCLHSDWAVAYFVNYFNISRHVVPTGHTHPYKQENDKVYWYNDQMGDIKQARLHAWHDGSEHYQKALGNCKNIGDKCNETSGVCHNVDEELFNSLHQKVTHLWPKKFRNLE
jgi:hypothetical protein